MADYKGRHAAGGTAKQRVDSVDADLTTPVPPGTASAASPPGTEAESANRRSHLAGGRRGIPAPVVAIAVLALQAGFIASYVGGLHAPSATHVPVAVVGDSGQVDQLRARLGAASGIVSLRQAPSDATADDAIRDRDVDGAYNLATGELTIASGRGPALADVLTPVFTKVASANGQQLSTRDLAPLPSGDPRGLVTFYLVIGWIVGAYLLAAVLGLLSGMAVASVAAALSRLGILAGYAVASGIIGVAIVENGFGYAEGNFWPLAAIGVLLVFAVAAATVGIESVLGLIGTGLAILAFVVMGNPSAGGPWPINLLPSPWREVGPWLPNGAGLTGVRQVLFFDGRALTQPLVVLAIYAVVGVVLTMATTRRGRPLVDLLAH